MAWLTVEQIRKKFNIAPNLFEAQIEGSIASAALLMRREWLSSEIYDEAESETVPTEVDELIRQQSLIEAHANLAMYYLTERVGNRLSELGFIEQSAAGTSSTQQGVTHKAANAESVERIQARFLKTAQDFAGQYALIDFSGAVVVSEAPVLETTLKWF